MSQNPLGVFEAVYGSGLFIDDPQALTALCLLFERVHIPNYFKHLETFVRANSERFHGEANKLSSGVSVSLKARASDDEFLSALSNSERKAAGVYLTAAVGFYMKNRPLLGSILQSSMVPHPEQFEQFQTVLREDGDRESIIRLTADIQLTTGPTTEIDRLVESGAVPLFTRTLNRQQSHQQTIRSRDLASLFAIKSVELVLPQFKPAHPHEIVEARERLKDHLPPFWAAMLRLSKHHSDLAKEGLSARELQFECQEIVDTVVRPAVIDLDSKLRKERKNWFYRIISPLAGGLKLIATKPPTTPLEMLSLGVALGSDVGVEVAKELLRDQTSSAEMDLSYLVELKQMLRSE